MQRLPTLRSRDAFFATILAILPLTTSIYAEEEDEIAKDIQSLQQKPKATSDESIHQLVDSLLPMVAKEMGLSAPAHVNVKLLSRDEAKNKLLRVLQRDYPGDTLTRLGIALSAVGLIDENTNLTSAAQAMYGSNVGGFYDPHEHVLYLLADQPMDAQTLVVAHELAHAVQDEHFHLDSISSSLRSSEDAQLAFSAAIEGQAQAVAAHVLTAQMGELGMGDMGAAQMLAQATGESAAAAGSQAAVPWLGLQMGFPYSFGGKLVEALGTDDDQVGKAMVKRLPRSTAQVIDPSLYRKDEKPRVAKLDLEHLVSGSSIYSTVLGAANLQLFGDLHQASRLPEGWRGDRLEVVRKEGQVVAVWVVNFSNANQAQRLAKAFANSVHGSVGGFAKQEDGSIYRVEQNGSTAMLFENIPAAQWEAVKAAAMSAFEH